MSKVVHWQLSWGRFCIVAIPMGTLAVLAFWALAQMEGMFWSAFAAPSAIAIILAFLAQRWETLRKAQSAGTLPTVVTNDQALRLMVGPFSIAALWWLAACIVGMAFIVVPFLLRSPP